MKSIREWKIEQLCEVAGVNLDYVRQFLGDSSFQVDPKLRSWMQRKNLIKDLLEMFPDPNEAFEQFMITFASELLDMGPTFSATDWKKVTSKDPYYKAGGGPAGAAPGDTGAEFEMPPTSARDAARGDDILRQMRKGSKL